MKIVYFLLILFAANYSAAQNPRLNPNPNSLYIECDLEKSNDIFWTKVNQEIIPAEKLCLIKDKIVSDTIYKQYHLDLRIASNQRFSEEHVDQYGNLCGLKILFVLAYGKKSVFVDLLDHPKYRDILNEIDIAHAVITLLPASEGGTNLFGYRGSSGVVSIKINNRKLAKKIGYLIKH